MRRFLLDTNAAGHYINQRRGIRERTKIEIALGNHIGVATPVLSELWFGVENSANRDRNVQLLLRAVATWRVWPYDNKSAPMYGRIAADLKRMGRPIQQVDMIIAAIAMSIGNCTVVTSDSDLAIVPGLTVENWETT